MKKSQEINAPDSCWNKAQPDELVFVILGRDTAAPAAVEAWIQQRLLSGKNTSTDPQMTEAREWVRQVRASHIDLANKRTRINTLLDLARDPVHPRAVAEITGIQLEIVIYLANKHPKLAIADNLYK